MHYWDAIGYSSSYYFSGAYDGGEYTISGLYTEAGSSSTYDYQGLFGYVVGQSETNMATIKNVGIIDSNIQGYRYVGGVVGYAYSYAIIADCYNNGNVTGSSSYTGGIIGSGYSTITNCYNTGSVTGSSSNVGGIIGSGSPTINNCYNSGVVSGLYDVGGIIGRASNAIITNCHNIGDISKRTSRAVTQPEMLHGFAGIVGFAGYSTMIVNCYNTGTVNGISYPVGGVVGEVYDGVIITNCYNTGAVNGISYPVGGVVGSVTSDSNSSIVTVTNCYNTGNITGSAFVGGVVGDASDSTIINCYNTGAVDGSSDVGGVVGYSVSTIVNCYNTGKVTGDDYVGGVVGRDYNSASTITNCYYGGNCTLSYGIGYYSSNIGASKDSNLIANAKSLSWYQDSSKWRGGYLWNFDDIWQIDSNKNNGYPYLSDSSYSALYPNDLSQYWTNAGNYADSFAGGSGTESDPYKISTPEQLARLAYLVNNGSEQYMFSNTYFVQTANLDMSEYWWDAIGTYTSSSDYLAFSGHYDGGEYTISGLYTEAGSDSAYSYQGLFGYVSSQFSSTKATIKNVGITDSNIQGYQYVGGVVGEVSSSTDITNCYNTGSVYGQGSYVGGVVGYAYDEFCAIAKCFNTGSVNGGGCVGGVVGNVGSDSVGVISDPSTVTNCYNTGAVNGSGDTGGIVGYAGDSIEITNCYNTGNVNRRTSRAGDPYVGPGCGGIVGYGYHSLIINCYNTGSVTEGYQFDGVMGSGNFAYIDYCYYGGNCTLTVGHGTKDENLIANAKSLNWYQDSSKWASEYPWDFVEVWSLVPSANDGYPILQGFSVNISYNSNFGENETITEQVPSGQEIVIAGYDLFTRVGYEISHWNTKADGTGLNFYAGDTYSEGAGLTLYAIWEAGIYSITLDANGGSGGTQEIWVKYGYGFYANSSATGNSITSLTSLPTREGYTFNGFYTSAISGTRLIDSTGKIVASNTFATKDVILYAQWVANNPAKYDSEGGYWYVENGKLPQSMVGESLKATLEGQWGSLSEGSVYYMGVEELADGDLTTDGGMQSKVYNGNEYVKFNGEYYLVEPIRWRLTYSSEQDEGYAVENTSVLATMAEIVFVGSYSSTKIGAGEGYSAESVTMLLKNQVSDDYLVSESREVEIFGAPKATTTASGSVFVASCEELANFTTNKNNTTGSGVKTGKVSLSDFVKDYLRATGQGDYYFTRDLGDQLNSIFCFNPVGNRTQVKAQQVLGVQFTVKVIEYACKSV